MNLDSMELVFEATDTTPIAQFAVVIFVQCCLYELPSGILTLEDLEVL